MKPKVIICSKVERKNINSNEDFELINVESAVLSQELSAGDPGKIFTQTLDIIIDVDAVTAGELQTIPQLFKLTTSDGLLIEWGDNDYRCRCISCFRELDHTRITFKRYSTKPDV